MGYYHLKTHMFSINMGGCDIMLGVKWLRMLNWVIIGFKELYMIFEKDSHTHTPWAIKAIPPYITTYHSMENLLKKLHYGIIS